MFYVLNEDGVCVSTCSVEPDKGDLEQRNRNYIEFDGVVNIGDKYNNGVVEKQETVVDYITLARNYRNSLRNKIDDYLKPTSTLNDELITTEQKDILIKDSLLLARWPATACWPYIQLPELSELSNNLLNNPVWTYPMEKPADGN